MSPTGRLSFARWGSYALIAAAGTSLDLATKQLIFDWRGIPGTSEPWWLIEDYVGIETAVNVGALFGLGAGFGNVFAALSVIAAIAIFVWLGKFRAIDSWWLLIALGCVTGGIFGNLYDRLGLWYHADYPPQWKSAVRDWILLRYHDYTWPNFNVADSLLVCGAVMLAIHSFLVPPAQSRSENEN